MACFSGRCSVVARLVRDDPQEHRATGRSRFFVLTAGGAGPATPDTAARWPYLTGPATAADEYYEDAAHDGSRVGRLRPAVARFPEGFSKRETPARITDQARR